MSNPSCLACGDTGDCTGCSDALILFDTCGTCRGTGGCPNCNPDGEFAGELPAPREG